MAIGSYVTGAEYGFIYIRDEYPLAVERVRHAIAQAEERGILGNDMLGSGHPFHLEVVKGAGRLRLRRGDRPHRLYPGLPRHAPHQTALPGPGRRLHEAH